APVIGACVVIAVGRILHGPVMALAVAVKPVDHRVTFGGAAVIGRQKDAEIARLAENFAVVSPVGNEGFGRAGRRIDNREESREYAESKRQECPFYYFRRGGIIRYESRGRRRPRRIPVESANYRRLDGRRSRSIRSRNQLLRS